jgi:hypothetical protein
MFRMDHSCSAPYSLKFRPCRRLTNCMKRYMLDCRMRSSVGFHNNFDMATPPFGRNGWDIPRGRYYRQLRHRVKKMNAIGAPSFRRRAESRLIAAGG